MFDHRRARLYLACLLYLVGGTVLGCSSQDDQRRDRGEGAASIRLVDDSGREVVLADPATRIVSLIPAVTEVAFAMGAGDRLVGRTRYGVHPPEAKRVPVVGGGIRPDPEPILARRPDLVLMYAGSGNRSSLDRLRDLGLKVLAIRHNTLSDLRTNIRRFGVATGMERAADSLWAAIDSSLTRIARSQRRAGAVRVYYAVADELPYTIGAGSYLDTLLHIAGGSNVFGDLAQPSPMVGLEAVIARAPDCILIGTVESENAARARLRQRPGWSRIPAVAEGRVVVVEAELIHRLGPRIGAAADRLRAALDRCRPGEPPSVE